MTFFFSDIETSVEVDNTNQSKGREESLQEEKGIPTICTPVPEEVVREIRARNKLRSLENRLLYLVLFDVYFMGRKTHSLECPSRGSLRHVLQTVLRDVRMMIRNRFSFYVYVSPYDVIWNRDEGELMREPEKSNAFRHLVTPDQIDMNAKSLIAEHGIPATERLNVYLFIKQMDDVFLPSTHSTSMSWRLENVFG